MNRIQKQFAALFPQSPQQHTNGFILIYTLILISVILGIVGLNFSRSLSEVFASRNQDQSMKAFYAADTGIECVRYWHGNFNVFDTTEPAQSYSCGVGNPFTAGTDPPTSTCEAHTYTFTLRGFSNGACADVKVTTIPRIIKVNGEDVTVCSLSVISNGRNSCSASGNNLIERTRWEDM